MSFSETPPAGNFDETNFPVSQAERDSVREVLEANRGYVENFGDKARLVGAPRRRMAILTCMDARMDPAKFCGLGEGDAHVIRNAGGRASEDAIRSLVVSGKLMGTTDWFVIHHSGCGMQAYSDEEIRRMLGIESEDVQHAAAEWGHVWKSARTPSDIEWMTFSDLVQSIVEDVQRIRTHPLVPASVAIYGYIYHIHHGTLEAVAEANRIGAPQVEDS